MLSVSKPLGNDSNYVDVSVESVRSASVWRRDSLEWLDPVEIERCREIRHDLEKTRFLSSRFLLRESLARLTGISPGRWKFSRDDGRWKIARGMGLPLLHISTTHAQDAVAVAISDTCEVGIDLERIPQKIELSFEAAFTLREKKWLETLDEPKRISESLRIWSAKEAYSKLVGLGVDLDFASFDPDSSLHLQKNALIESLRWDVLRVPYWVSIAARDILGEAIQAERHYHGRETGH